MELLLCPIFSYGQWSLDIIKPRNSHRWIARESDIQQRVKMGSVRLKRRKSVTDVRCAHNGWHVVVSWSRITSLVEFHSIQHRMADP